MNVRERRPQLELWGGVECTVNRVRGEFFEQLGRSGHLSRFASDFEQFAALGIKALRTPVLWECTLPNGTASANWSWADASLHKLRELKIIPIVGLLHHGSGPLHTNLLDPELPEKLGEYAAAVAARYPWVENYTPVNEPLTTARFSALYGHWYPHHRSDLSFARALLNQCRASVLAMRAIRKINPTARLIQTDDLGKVFSSPRLKYQADFENERRWCSFDLLCGTVDSSHRMWEYFLWAGIETSELEWFLDNPCVPDVIGINHYLSGERYLDQSPEFYPPDTHGGNGKDHYADVLAARVLKSGAAGPARLISEAWERYQLPIAITECHNGCTREEQLRWLFEVWRGALQARRNGANVLAVTAWSLLGAFDWDTLVTQTLGNYEPGVYDVRSAPPRPTALAGLISDLAMANSNLHPVLDVPGWWRRRQRFVYGFSVNDDGTRQLEMRDQINDDFPNARPVLITDSGRMLAQVFAGSCEARGIPYRLVTAADISDEKSIARTLRLFHPWAVIDAAGYLDETDVQPQPESCGHNTALRAKLLAEGCASQGVQLLTFSSDLVFDGTRSEPYVETDPVSPADEIGRIKSQEEMLVLRAMPSGIIVRTGPLFAEAEKAYPAANPFRGSHSGEMLKVAADVVCSPTYAPDLVNASLDLLIDDEGGIWHLVNRGAVSRAQFAAMAISCAEGCTQTLRPVPVSPGARTISRALASNRGALLPTLEDALVRFTNDSAKLRARAENVEAADIAAD